MQLWCEDEAREGQKGRTGHRWFTRGVRPPGRRDRRFLSTYIFAAVRPGHDDAFALVLPEARAVTMDLFLARFSETLPAGVHAVLMLDQAGWHGRAALQVLCERHSLVALCPVRPHPGDGFLVNADHLVAGPLGEGGEITLLPLARLIRGRDPAVERDALRRWPLLSQLDSLCRAARKPLFRLLPGP